MKLKYNFLSNTSLIIVIKLAVERKIKFEIFAINQQLRGTESGAIGFYMAPSDSISA